MHLTWHGQPAVCESSITLPTVQASLKSIPQATHCLTPPPPQGGWVPLEQGTHTLGGRVHTTIQITDDMDRASIPPLAKCSNSLYS